MVDDPNAGIAGGRGELGVVAVALHTMLIADEDEARRIIEDTERRTGLPVDDPVRFGPGPLWRAIEPAVDALPWVEARASA